MVNYIDEVPIFQNTAYFNDWLNANGYYNEVNVKNIMLSEGYSDDEIQDELKRLFDEFIEWCDLNNITGDY